MRLGLGCIGLSGVGVGVVLGLCWGWVGLHWVGVGGWGGGRLDWVGVELEGPLKIPEPSNC